MLCTAEKPHTSHHWKHRATQRWHRAYARVGVKRWRLWQNHKINLQRWCELVMCVCVCEHCASNCCRPGLTRLTSHHITTYVHGAPFGETVRFPFSVAPRTHTIHTRIYNLLKQNQNYNNKPHTFTWRIFVRRTRAARFAFAAIIKYWNILWCDEA